MYFYEDEVYHIDKSNSVKFGLVIETEENIEEFEGKNSKNGNFLKVVWHNDGRDEIISSDKVSECWKLISPSSRRKLPEKDFSFDRKNEKVFLLFSGYYAILYFEIFSFPVVYK